KEARQRPHCQGIETVSAGVPMPLIVVDGCHQVQPRKSRLLRKLSPVLERSATIRDEKRLIDNEQRLSVDTDVATVMKSAEQRLKVPLLIPASRISLFFQHTLFVASRP